MKNKVTKRQAKKASKILKEYAKENGFDIIAITKGSKIYKI
jgi:hypothetical protein